MTAIYTHNLFLKHLEGYEHPERPARLQAVLDRIRGGAVADRVTFVEAQAAEPGWIELVHEPGYVKRILEMTVATPTVLDWGDTVATAATPQAASHAAGCGVQAVRAVVDGEYANAFCAVRPPGHHAEFAQPMGFCLFNNIAVAASWLVNRGGLSRVAIVDWDVHHGNGTERAFLADDRVLFISLHQYPHYPGSGGAEVVGTGEGVGFTLNLPMAAGAGDAEYLEAFEQRVIPRLDEFKPQFMLISAGFDAHRYDPLSSINLSSEVYGQFTVMLREVANRYAGGQVVSFLEGGYNLETLAESVEQHLIALCD